MDHESRRVDGHGTDVQDLRIEDQGVHNAVQAALDHQRGQRDLAFLEGDDARADPDVDGYVFPLAQGDALLRGQQAVDPPGGGGHSFHEALGEVRKRVGGSLGGVFQDEPVLEGVRHDGAVALDDGLEKGLPSGNETLGESRQRNKPRG